MATPTHRKNERRLFGLRTTTVGVGVSAVAIAAIVGGVVVFAARHSGPPGATASSGAGASGGASTTTAPLPPLTVVSISPAASATNVAPGTPIQITFSQPLARDATKPTLTPAVAGTWTQSGPTMTFQPQGGYMPWSSEAVTVPATTAAAPVHKRVTTLATPYQAS